MKILYLAITPPAPPTNGHRVRQRSLLRALAAEGHQVSMLSYATPEEVSAPSLELAELCAEYRLITMPQCTETIGRLRALFSPLPFGAWRMRAGAMRAAATAKLAEGFDLIICEDIYMAGSVPADSGLPVLLNKDDITHRIVDQFVRGESNRLKKIYGRIEYRKVRRLELQVCASATAVLPCSEVDRDLLQRDCPQARFVVLPNVIDVESYRVAEGDDGRTVVFSGAMDWLPNQDGVEYFANEIMPILRELAPGTRLVVAGRNPSAGMRTRFAGYPDIEFTGTLPNLSSAIAPAAVCVVPLRIGSGTRMKILEAAALGKAVVSTSLGAEGLELVDGKEILIADNPRQFADAVALLLRDHAQRRELGRAARAKVEECFGYKALRKALVGAFETWGLQSAGHKGAP